MLTIDFARLGLRPGERVLDLGCGTGRHSFECLRRSAVVVAVDADEVVLKEAGGIMAAMSEAGEVPARAAGTAVRADALALPFASASFDKIICAEVLEHLADDRAALSELARVLRPGGLLAISVPRYGPELVNWALSSDYHNVAGGHIRIYRRSQLRERLEGAGLELVATHHAHALHSPYWWLRCLVGVDNERCWAVRAYHRLLVWDITARSPLTRVPEALLNPVLGKSLVAYARHLET